MVPYFPLLTLLVLFPPILVLGQDQVPLTGDVSEGNGILQKESRLKLHGRFLHLTDIHLDPLYRLHTRVKYNCHTGSGRAGYFGTPGTDCDSPHALVNATFQWIEDNLKDNIDFVIWTGDAARHDKDDDIPRTREEIRDLNQLVFDKFLDTFQDHDSKTGGRLKIPVVPTIGNNDIMPHNIFRDAPNEWTDFFSRLWYPIIPEDQRHSFAQGGWFYVEVVPDRLAVVSLNTMYFYSANGAVDGCMDKSEPGYQHMEWLRTRLQLLREKGMKAIFMGHVPPARTKSRSNWEESCWQKYALWLRQYRDVIVGSAYGHMNMDHFMLHDFSDIELGRKSETSDEPVNNKLKEKSVSRSRANYLYDLRDQWSDLPQPPSEKFTHLYADSRTQPTDPERSRGGKYLEEIGGPWAERYALSLVSPSVVPNYFPSLRVVEYNISGLENATLWFDKSSLVDQSQDRRSSTGLQNNTKSLNPAGIPAEPIDKQTKKKKKKKKKNRKKKPKFKVPKPPSKTAPPGPAYSNQPFTWLGYTQYFADLGRSNDDFPNAHTQSGNYTNVTNFYEIEYNTRSDRYYILPDLTMNSCLDFARSIAAANRGQVESDFPKANIQASQDESTSRPEFLDGGNSRNDNWSKQKRRTDLWTLFLRRAFVGYLDDDDIDKI
ncbi:Endopolyphosphatase [Myotisia sp. PD_48]|nr:Endopolyphosphatase [Myotisia sp. PD_48]